MNRPIGAAPRIAAALFAVAMLGSCGSAIPAVPSASQAAAGTSGPTAVAPGPTDYGNAASWLTRPAVVTMPVDVFYIAPTEYTRGSPSASIIGAFDDPGTVAGVKAAFSREATAFAPVANIFAPYYRQADAAARAALPQAQQDAIVAGAPTEDGIAAFDYYIKHDNGGRPFFLAGHSLGSNVIANLLASYMPSHPDVYKRMIAAYAVGYSITPDYLARNPSLTFATGATDTGVIVSWNTEAPTVGGPNPVLLPGGLAINPITWTTTETLAAASANLGSVVLTANGTPATDAEGNVTRVVGLADAQVDTAKGVVIVTTVPVEQYSPGGPGQFPKGVYHGYDIPFFFFDLQRNAADRAAAYFAATMVAPSLIVEPDAGYQPFYDLIATARRSVEVVMYALVDPKADAALIAAAKRGVDVKVLLDSDPTAGGGPATNQDAFDDLAANGVDVRWAWTGTLWHQKSILVDGEVAAIMSANLVAADYPVVRDYAVVTHNPATVAGMAATFAADFAKTTVAPTPGVVPEGSELVWSPGAESSLADLIGLARAGTTMYVETEQLGSAPLEQALIAAVQRGVTVNLTMTTDPSYSAALDTLKAGGVHVRLYATTAAIYIHAKAMSVNDDTVFVGSTNLTSAMTDQNRNVGIITRDPAVVRGITATLAADFAGATPY